MHQINLSKSFGSAAPENKRGCTTMQETAKAAFTLAEVLITLAIIGIVAALTIPELMQSYKKKEYSTKLKKFYSTMQQAIQLSTVQNGEVDTWDKKDDIPYTEIEDEDEKEQAKLTNAKDGFEFVNKYILPYMKYSKVEEEQPLTVNNSEIFKLSKVYLNDGTTFFIYNGDCIDFFYDVNGNKEPNKEGYDIYRFIFSPVNKFRQTSFGSEKQYFGTYGYGTYTTNTEDYREYIHEQCTRNGKYCSHLIYLDNWEYKDDYPYKI